MWMFWEQGGEGAESGSDRKRRLELRLGQRGDRTGPSHAPMCCSSRAEEEAEEEVEEGEEEEEEEEETGGLGSGSGTGVMSHWLGCWATPTKDMLQESCCTGLSAVSERERER